MGRRCGVFWGQLKGRINGGFDQDTLHTFMEFSKNKKMKANLTCSKYPYKT